jgi:hypothetical protein
MNAQEFQKILRDDGYDFGEDAAECAFIGYELALNGQVAPQATELDSVTISKMNTLRENGMRQVGVVMMDDSGKRATIDMGKVLWSTSKADTGEAIHYPECWDTATYPTLQDAIRAIGAFKCANYDGQHDGAIRNAALEEAAKWVDQRRFDFENEHGSMDYGTGVMEFGRGAHAAVKEEYDNELAEIAESIRAMKSSTPSPIKAAVHPDNDLIQTVDRYLSAAYQAGMDGDEFDMLTPKREIAVIKAEPKVTDDQLWRAYLTMLNNTPFVSKEDAIRLGREAMRAEPTGEQL